MDDPSIDKQGYYKYGYFKNDLSYLEP